MKIKYKIENFKSFSNSGDIEFSPITVLCGINSVGKSSIIKSILLAKQSAAVRRSALASSTSPQPLILNGEFAQLGSWSDTITNHDRDRSLNISWGVEASGDEYREALSRAGIRPQRRPPPRKLKGQTVALSVGLSSDPKVAEERSVRADFWKLNLNGSNIEISRSEKVTENGDSLYKVEIDNIFGLLSRNESQIGRYSLYLGDTVKAISAEKGRISLGHISVNTSGPFIGGLTAVFDESWFSFFDAIPKIANRYRGIKRGPQPEWINHLESAARSYRKSTESGENVGRSSPAARSIVFLAVELVEEVARAHAEAKAIVAPMWRDIRYLGPLRDQPRRYYQFDDTGGADVGVSGEFTVQILELEKSKELISRQATNVSGRGIEFSAPVEGTLLSHTNHWLDFMGLPSVKPSSLEQSLYKLEVGELAVGLLDVGFGVSQVLPIIVEALRAHRGDLVILEQPEIHLHPRVQAQLADFLLARSLDGVRFLVESHSEYLIKRLCRRIAEAHDVETGQSTNLYFVEGVPGKATCKKIPVNEFGEIESWPKGFFDLDEDLYWAKASLTKRRAQKKN